MDTTCNEHDGYFDSYGYGVVRVGGKPRKAHRVAYVQSRGLELRDIDGMVVCHTCDNPPCVNPDHLFLGTPLDNNRDKVRKGRQPRNEAHKSTVLPNSKIARIFKLRKAGLSQQRIADEVGCSQTHVSRILRGKSRTHV